VKHKLAKLWQQIRWISRSGYFPLNWSSDPEIKRLAKKAGKREPKQNGDGAREAAKAVKRAERAGLKDARRHWTRAS